MYANPTDAPLTVELSNESNGAAFDEVDTPTLSVDYAPRKHGRCRI
jgi:hypothetical protein